jgi:hypothetical protein
MLRLPPNQFRLAGLAAALGGMMLVVASIVQFVHLAHPNLLQGSGSSSIIDSSLYVRSLFWPLGDLLVALGLVGLYARRSEELGILGRIGFVLAFLSLALMRGTYLAVLFADLGVALFGAASLRGRIYPRALTMLLVLNALIGEVFNPTVTVGSVPLGYVGAGAAVIEQHTSLMRRAIV